MKLAVIYDLLCPKLRGDDYSGTYLDMFEALIQRFEDVQRITESCSAQDIEADVIVIFDIHSSHHIVIDGLIKHKAVKYTYFNDPHQMAIVGIYNNDSCQFVHKLGAKKRTGRALKRGVDFIICPSTNFYYKYIAPHLGKNAEKMLFWFPPAPSHKHYKNRLRKLKNRHHKILANGITWGNAAAYNFRIWAYAQKESYFIEHAFKRPDVPKGFNYGELLANYAASLALCDTIIVPKYLEIPLAGCLCFAQHQPDYEKMGFEDGVNCILVNQKNFKERTRAFLNSDLNKNHYQSIASSGRMLINNKWTAECFAEALYNHAQKHINQSNSKETKP